MTGHLPPSPIEALIAAAASRLDGLNRRMDSIEAGVNARLNSRDQVVAAIAETIDRLATRIDSYEEGRTSATEALASAPGEDDDIDFKAGGTDPETGFSATPDAELFEQEPTLKTGPEPEYRHTPPPEYQPLPAMEE